MRSIWLFLLVSSSAAGQTPPPQVTDAQVVQRVEPEYTDEARAAKLEGIVTVYLEIDEAGKPDNVGVIQGLGLGLDEKSVEAVRQWRFTPAMKNGNPLRTAQGVDLGFRLDTPQGWRIRHSAYKVRREDRFQSEPVVKPTLRQYTRPAAEACGGEGGMVRVEMSVGKDGLPSGIALAGGESDAMGQAVLAAARSWIFQPALGSNEPRAATASLLLECGTAMTAPTAGAVRVGGGVSVPSLQRKTEPEYSEDARKSKYQGNVLINLEVDPAGIATNLRISRMLGLGLDRKAMEAVKQWQFKPGMRDGKPIKVMATIEVNFRLL